MELKSKLTRQIDKEEKMKLGRSSMKEVKCYVSMFMVVIMVVLGFAGCSSKSKKSESTSDTDTSLNGGTSYTINDEWNGNSQSQAEDVDAFDGADIVDNETDYSKAMEPDRKSTIHSKMDNDVAAVKDESEIYNYNTENNYIPGNIYNTEEYNPIIENDFLSAYSNPLSTFSIDVDTASYSNVRRMILDYDYVDPDAVRLEEMINYFKYDYPQPKSNVPFSVTTELSDCPWNEDTKLLLIGLQAKDIDLSDRPKSNIVFLLDVSGSMDEPDKLPLMQKAFAMLTENLTENDRISIVTYAGEDKVVLKGARGDQTQKIVSALMDLSAGGSTAGSAGIKTAYQLAEKYFIEGGNNRVILATDGDLNVGITSEEGLTRLIEQEREKGVFLSVLGFGTGNLKDNKMEALADNGNGNYAYIDSILEAKKVLVEELGGTLFTVAKDVKLQVEFNPNQVKGYRLIGYENRKLNKEDFNDDTKDAGEIGAGHSVTALYEIATWDSSLDVPSSKLKYQTEVKSPKNKEWLTINIRYKDPDGDKSKLLSVPVDGRIYTKKMPENLAFASSVASFGMLLRDSEWKGTATYDKILAQLDELNIQNDEYKLEFATLVKMMKRRNGYDLE